ncbi:MAG TPA: hypothetical protein VFC19_21500 [Candidatus Limnocylindrales bacterium]|nr:hypothetical protein [Candidatus Limnocylindrales bacterium]
MPRFMRRRRNDSHRPVTASGGLAAELARIDAEYEAEAERIRAQREATVRRWRPLYWPLMLSGMALFVMAYLVSTGGGRVYLVLVCSVSAVVNATAIYAAIWSDEKFWWRWRSGIGSGLAVVGSLLLILVRW